MSDVTKRWLIFLVSATAFALMIKSYLDITAFD